MPHSKSPAVGRRSGRRALARPARRSAGRLLRDIDCRPEGKAVTRVGATTRPEQVEPALLRSGWFDYTVRFARPDAADRVAIARLCCRQIPLAADVDLEAIA